MIRKLLLGSAGVGGLLVAALPASAADLVTPAPVVVPVPAFSWTAFYVGGNLGGVWGNRNNWFNDPSVYPTIIGFPNGFGTGHNRSGFTGGGQIGLNWQTGLWVLGIEGDIEYVGNARNTKVGVDFTLPELDARGTAPGPRALGPGTYTAFFTGDGGSEVLSTIRGRFGVAWDRWLVYGTGGAAFRGSNHVAAFVNDAAGTTVASFTCGEGFTCKNANTVGWAAGVGGQYAITNNVSLGVEYLHAEFDSRDRVDPILSAYYGTPTTWDRGNWSVDMVRARLDVNFNGLLGP